MRSPRTLLRPVRSLAGLILLATLVAGEVADTRHHLSEHGCAAEAGQAQGSREEQCTCAGIHAAPLAGHAPVLLAVVLERREHAPPAERAAPQRHGEAEAAPRAPPRS